MRNLRGGAVPLDRSTAHLNRHLDQIDSPGGDSQTTVRSETSDDHYVLSFGVVVLRGPFASLIGKMLPDGEIEFDLGFKAKVEYGDYAYYNKETGLCVPLKENPFSKHARTGELVMHSPTLDSDKSETRWVPALRHLLRKQMDEYVASLRDFNAFDIDSAEGLNLEERQLSRRYQRLLKAERKVAMDVVCSHNLSLVRDLERRLAHATLSEPELNGYHNY